MILEYIKMWLAQHQLYKSFKFVLVTRGDFEYVTEVIGLLKKSERHVYINEGDITLLEEFRDYKLGWWRMQVAAAISKKMFIKVFREVPLSIKHDKIKSLRWIGKHLDSKLIAELDIVNLPAAPATSNINSKFVDTTINTLLGHVVHNYTALLVESFNGDKEADLDKANLVLEFSKIVDINIKNKKVTTCK